MEASTVKIYHVINSSSAMNFQTVMLNHKNATATHLAQVTIIIIGASSSFYPTKALVVRIL